MLSQKCMQIAGLAHASWEDDGKIWERINFGGSVDSGSASYSTRMKQLAMEGTHTIDASFKFAPICTV